MTKLDQLRDVLDGENFHHATYRNLGSLWEGLYIYVKSPIGRGFKPWIVFGKNDPDLIQAEDMVRRTGISVGGYGEG